MNSKKSLNCERFNCKIGSNFSFLFLLCFKSSSNTLVISSSYFIFIIKNFFCLVFHYYRYISTLYLNMEETKQILKSMIRKLIILWHTEHINLSENFRRVLSKSIIIESTAEVIETINKWKEVQTRTTIVDTLKDDVLEICIKYRKITGMFNKIDNTDIYLNMWLEEWRRNLRTTNNNDLINQTKIINEIQEKAKHIKIITEFEYNHEVDNWLKEQIKEYNY